jgi:hypothetical protein
MDMGRSIAAAQCLLLAACLPSSFFGGERRPEHVPIGPPDAELDQTAEFYAWIPPGSESLIYADFRAIRRTPAMHEAGEYFSRWVTGPRTDVARLFSADDCGLFDDSRRVLLASPVGTWTWVFTVEYDTADRTLAGRLDEVLPGPSRTEGALEVRALPGWSPEPFVAHPKERTVVIATHDMVQTIGAQGPTLVDLVHEGDLAAWRASGGISQIAGLSDAYAIEAHLRAVDDDRAPLGVAIIAHYADPSLCESARLSLVERAEELRHHSMARMLGFDRTLAEARITTDGSDLYMHLRLTPSQAAVITDVALSSIDLPDGM